MRKPHYISTNTNGELPSRMIFFDTETHAEKLSSESEYARLTFGYAVFERRQGKQTDGEEWLRFETTNEFWNWIESKCHSETKTYIFAHNLGVLTCK